MNLFVNQQGAQMAQTDTRMTSDKTGFSNGFQQLIQEELSVNWLKESNLSKGNISLEDAESLEELINLLALLLENEVVGEDKIDLDSLLAKLIKLKEDKSINEDDLLALKTAIEMLQELEIPIIKKRLDIFLDKIDIRQVDKSDLVQSMENEEQNNLEKIITTNELTVKLDEASTKKMLELIAEINKALDSYEGRSNELARHILQLLERWTQLHPNGPVSQSDLEAKFSSKKNEEIWQELVKTYEKREKLSKQLIYRNESSITSQDISRWLERALSQYETQNSQQESQAQMTQSSSLFSMPMNEIQQFDIHLHTTNRVEKISNELVSQLTNIIQKSNFMQARHINQLTVTLNPENLGNITVRLVEIDGEMIVKLLVTSSLTKKALESNIHQLKHMFSPHQISIEREEGISDEEFFADDEELADETLEEGNESEENEEEAPEVAFGDLLQGIREEEDLVDEN